MFFFSIFYQEKRKLFLLLRLFSFSLSLSLPLSLSLTSPVKNLEEECFLVSLEAVYTHKHLANGARLETLVLPSLNAHTMRKKGKIKNEIT